MRRQEFYCLMSGLSLTDEHRATLLKAAQEILNSRKTGAHPFKGQNCEGVLVATRSYAVVGVACGAVFEGRIETSKTDKPAAVRFVAGGMDWPEELLEGEPTQPWGRTPPMSSTQIKFFMDSYYEQKRSEFASAS